MIDMRYLCVTLSVFPSVYGEHIVGPKKTTTLNLRIDPILKEAAKTAAYREQRSVANMIEVLIRRHCEKVGITIPDQQTLFDDNGDE